MTKSFALQLLRRLQLSPAVISSSKARQARANGESLGEGEGDDMEMEDEEGQLPQEADVPLIQTEYLEKELKLPAEKGEIQQHTELLFALCVKVPSLLDE